LTHSDCQDGTYSSQPCRPTEKNVKYGSRKVWRIGMSQRLERMEENRKGMEREEMRKKDEREWEGR